MTIRPHPDPATPDATWRDVPVVGFTVAAGIAVLFCLVWLLRDGLTTDYTWGLLLAPVLMGVAGVAVRVLWERLLARVPRLVATLVAAVALLAGCASPAAPGGEQVQTLRVGAVTSPMTDIVEAGRTHGTLQVVMLGIGTETFALDAGMVREIIDEIYAENPDLKSYLP